MATFILVHGAWHGAWCWHKIVASLTAAGHRALAIDLPSHGDDPTPIGEVTLQTYADRVCQEIDAQAEPVVLVGHSLGGLVISQASEYRADQIASLVYLAAVLPAPGDTTFQPPDAPAVMSHVIPSQHDGAVEITPEGAVQVFYADCSEEDIAASLEQLCPQPASVLASPVELSAENFGRLPRYYIECLNDAAVSPEVQRRYYEQTPCRRVYSLKASHSPFFSLPRELAAILGEVAAAIDY